MLKPEIYQNNLRVDRETPIIDGAEIRYDNFDTIRAVMAKLYDINPAELNNAYITYKINNEENIFPRMRSWYLLIISPLIWICLLMKMLII